MTLIGVLIIIAILLISLMIHEVAHAVAADKLGDPTARLEGRVTLNPAAHLDPIGSVLLPGLLLIINAPFIFGWAKPVRYNPYNLENPKRDEALIAIAGPASNIALAIVAGLLIRMLPVESIAIVLPFLFYMVLINVVLALFNLVPIPPLDGSKLLFAVLPDSAEGFRRMLEAFGFILVLVFIIFFVDVLTVPIFNLTEFFSGLGPREIIDLLQG